MGRRAAEEERQKKAAGLVQQAYSYMMYKRFT
jgi:hypothetical protein